PIFFFSFFTTPPPPTTLYPLSLHDALPICEAGALVIAFVTLPFTFEGKRRNAQAREALARLIEVAHSVICFENDRMGDIVAPHAGIHQAFAMADTTISQSVRSIVQLIQRPGLIRVGFDDLLAALRPRNGRCLFGFGESDSDN